MSQKNISQRKNNTTENNYITNIPLITSTVINIIILTLLPSHFSFASITIIISSLYIMRMIALRKLTPSSIRFSARSGLVLSLVYGAIVLYWLSKGSYGCGGLFGVYSSCLISFQHNLLEIFVTLSAVLFVIAPLSWAHSRKKHR